jgi:hypothetical protein
MSAAYKIVPSAARESSRRFSGAAAPGATRKTRGAAQRSREGGAEALPERRLGGDCGSEHVEHGEDDANLRPPSEASGVDDTFWRMASRRDNPHGGSCVCAELADLRPKGPDRSLWPKAQGQPAQSGWPGPQGHSDSVGMAVAGMSLHLNGPRARIQGPPLGPWSTAVRRPHGPTARPFKIDRPIHLSTRVRQGYSPEGQRPKGSVHE